jgi:hypothetical protein
MERALRASGPPYFFYLNVGARRTNIACVEMPEWVNPTAPNWDSRTRPSWSNAA